MDVLSDVLRGVRLTGAVFFNMEAHSPWVASTPNSAAIAGMVMPEAEHVICFHLLTKGSCWAELSDGSQSPLALRAGDIVIVGKGDAHILCSTPGLHSEPDLAVYHRPSNRSLPLPHRLNQSTDGAEMCHFVCGYLGCDLRPFNPLIDALPRLFQARISDTTQFWLSNLLRAAVDETDDHKAGREAMLAKLAELIFVEVLRQHIAELEGDSRGWFSGLRDRHVGAALRLIHERPTENWTLESLARNVGLSRSAFAKRFSMLVGAPPIEYLAHWRMQLASKLLEKGISIAEAAANVGYSSETTFNRVFKRIVGTAPGAWRRAQPRGAA